MMNLMTLLKKLVVWWRGDLDPQARAEAIRVRDDRELVQAQSRARENTGDPNVYLGDPKDFRK
jgi:hypothetical protein